MPSTISGKREVSLFLAVSIISLLSLSPASGADEKDLTPSSWPEGADQYLKTGFGNEPHLGAAVHGKEMMIVGTTGAAAVRAGYEALLQGGSAVDAALTTSLAQIALCGGSWVSYAGIFTMVVYDAETGEVHTLNAAFDVPSKEDAPHEIPRQGSGIPSGRTALVPGFMAGVEAAHKRFGRLSFDTLFGPAIHFAEEGFEMPYFLAGMIEHRRKVLERLPATRRVFFGKEGKPIAAGELFRQPELAAFLRTVARDGAIHMYTGPWARRFVEIVQAEGGKITLEDMKRYKPVWSPPLRTTFKGFEIAALGLPSVGGVNTVECFNLLEAADIGPPSRSADDLFWWAQITGAFGLSFITPQALEAMLPDVEVTPEGRIRKEWARMLWERMQKGTFPLARPRKNPEGHSDAVVACDRNGNVVALVHSINTATWGETGIFVDGVSIPDAATHQQERIAAAGPGKRLPAPTNPLIVLEDGSPVLASSTIGAGLHQEAMLSLHHVLVRGLAPQAAISEPSLLLPSYDLQGRAAVQVQEGVFDPAVLAAVRKIGQPVTELTSEKARGVCGYWIGIRIDREAKDLQGGYSKGLNGGGFAK